MPRWEPNARERLESAALDLYTAKGYEHTTVGDIAELAGVTPRTFFRHFPDKRETLFSNADALRQRISDALTAAPPELTPIEATLHAISACEDLFHLRNHTDLRRRGSVIDESEELQERESRKLASFGAVMVPALVKRGATSDVAQLVADLAVVVFVQASRYWMEHPEVSFASQVARAAADARGALSP